MKRRACLVAVVSAALGGCATCTFYSPRAPEGPTAECPVCRENGDLACLRVTVREATPRTEHGGRVYYFCSEECRAEFERHPEKYASK